MTLIQRRAVAISKEQYDSVVAERDSLRSRLSRLKSIATLVDGGKYIVAWDTCARCLLHISLCKCSTGPQRPEHITRWMKGSHDDDQASDAS